MPTSTVFSRSPITSMTKWNHQIFFPQLLSMTWTNSLVFFGFSKKCFFKVTAVVTSAWILQIIIKQQSTNQSSEDLIVTSGDLLIKNPSINQSSKQKPCWNECVDSINQKSINQPINQSETLLKWVWIFQFFNKTPINQSIERRPYCNECEFIKLSINQSIEIFASFFQKKINSMHKKGIWCVFIFCLNYFRWINLL